MPPPSEELEAYLAPGETVVAGTSGALFDGSSRSAGVVAVTDRRVIFVAEGDGFVDVAHDAVTSIRGLPRRGFTYREMGPALVAVFGTGLAVAAAVGVLALEPDPLAFLLLAATVGGAAVAERVRRGGAVAGRRVLDDARAALAGAISAVDPLQGPLSLLRGRLAGTQVRGDRDLFVLGVVSLALTALVGLIAATGRLLVLPLALSVVGGVALAEYGYRRHREQDASGTRRPLGRDVSIHLVDGRVVHLRLDPGVRLDRDLSAVVRESAPRTATAELTEP